MALDASEPLLAVKQFNGEAAQVLIPMEFNPQEKKYLFRTQEKGLYLSNKFDEASNKLMLVRTGSANRICWALLDPVDFYEEEEESEETNLEAMRDKSYTSPTKLKQIDNTHLE